jgi:hypothetical protein
MTHRTVSPLALAITPALAVLVNPARHTDPAEVEKWFRCNCNEALGRQGKPFSP